MEPKEKRCNHQTKSEIRQYSQTIDITLIDGEYTLDWGREDIKDLGIVDLKCLTCGFEKRYKADKLPEWIRGRLG